MIVVNTAAIAPATRRRQSRCGFLILVLGTLLVPCVVSAATHYVSPTGSDFGTGTSAQPFRTIAKGVAAATAGDTIVLDDGTYGREGLTHNTSAATTFPVIINKAGTSTAWITLKAAHKGAAILDCEDVEGGQSGCDGYIRLGSSAAYWIIQDLVITRGYWFGIQNSNGHHITIKGCVFKDIGRHRNTLSYGEAGVYAGTPTHDLVYDGNVFHTIGRTGGTPVGRDHGLYIHGANSTVINNVFYEPLEGYGIRVGSGLSGLIANNTFALPQTSFDGTHRAGHITLCEQTGSLTIKNNIFYNPDSAGIHVVSGTTDPYKWTMQTGATCTISKNMFYGVSSLLDNSSVPCTLSANTVANPQFENVTPAAPYDFHLLSYSPAIDAGASVSAVSKDFDGHPRPQGSSYDIGAYEFGSGSGSAVTSPSTSSLAFSLAPASSSLSVPKGQSGTTSISAVLVSGSPTPVTLSIASLPAGVTVSFSKATCTVTCSSTLTFTPSSTATKGTYNIAVKASGGGVSAATSIALTITDPLSEGLKAWWQFSEGAGTQTLDSSGNGNTGVLNGNPTWASGSYGSAIALDGAGDFVAVKESPSLEMSTQMTVSFWYSAVDVPSVNESIVSKAYSWSIVLNGTGRAPKLIAGSKYALLTASVPVGKWTHVTFTFSAGTVKGYVNGVQSAALGNTFAAGDTLPLKQLGLLIGADSAKKTFARGLIDGVRIYNRPLTASEVAALYSQTKH